eukprot:474231-Prorocentrum_minimum.AAC.2
MAGAPMKMPDGRSLAQWIADSEKTGEPGRARTGPISVAVIMVTKFGGSLGQQTFRRDTNEVLALGKAARQHAVLREQWSEEEDMIADMEIQALMRVGARRRNRWFNERILRELAGTCCASSRHDRGLGCYVTKWIPRLKYQGWLTNTAVWPQYNIVCKCLTGDICRAGPMDAQDMHAQYTPPPFGVPAPPSIIATAIVRAPRPTCSRLLVPLTT